MDHLPTLQEAEPIDIPYLCAETYDFNGFSEYPQRKGWNKTLFYETGHCGGRSHEEVEEFFQTWLYFGTLCEVFLVSGIRGDLGRFIRNGENGERFVTTEYLRTYIKGWKEEEQEPRRVGTEAEDEVQAQSKISCLKRAIELPDSAALAVSVTLL